MESKFTAQKIKHIEEEMDSLKLMEKTKHLGKEVVHLKNVLEGIKVTEEEIKEAKKKRNHQCAR